MATVSGWQAEKHSSIATEWWTPGGKQKQKQNNLKIKIVASVPLMTRDLRNEAN